MKMKGGCFAWGFASVLLGVLPPVCLAFACPRFCLPEFCDGDITRLVPYV